MASKGALKRLMKEYAAIQQSPPPFILAKPNEKNILEWHYVLTGPPDSPYHHGEYHGKVVFPSDYPFKPPSIQMNTPSGRFRESTKLCLSMSDFHPESWNPSWSVASILTGLLSFMLEQTSTTGSMESSDAEKRAYAIASRKFNRTTNQKFVDMFPELAKEPIELASPAGACNPSAVVASLPRRDLLDQDLIGDELRQFLNSRLVLWLVGGVAFYLIVKYGVSVVLS